MLFPGLKYIFRHISSTFPIHFSRQYDFLLLRIPSLLLCYDVGVKRSFDPSDTGLRLQNAETRGPGKIFSRANLSEPLGKATPSASWTEIGNFLS